MSSGRAAWLKEMATIHGDLMTMDGYDDCIVGLGFRAGQEPLVVYDREKVIQQLMTVDGMDRDEAEEFFGFNQGGAWMGEKTPLFLETAP